MSAIEMNNLPLSDECAFPCLNNGRCVKFQYRSMCNCRTGYTGDACQMRHYDNELMFVFEDDYKSQFEDSEAHILRYQIALSAVVIMGLVCMIFTVWRFKRLDNRAMKMNRKIQRLASDSSEPSSTSFSPSEKPLV